MTLELKVSVPGESSQHIPLGEPTMVIGGLLSNQIVIRADGVDPIHALLECVEDGTWILTDLGSESGVTVNGKKIEVECEVQSGDQIDIGEASLELSEYVGAEMVAADVVPNVQESETSKEVPDVQVAKRAVGDSTSSPAHPPKVQESRRQRVLFSPRDARPSGRILEVVAYWGNTVLEVEHFSPTLKGFEDVTIGDPTKAHFIAAGKENITEYRLGSAREDGYSIYLRSGMSARLRKGGKIIKADEGKVNLDKRDIAHIKYGSVSYFMLFVQPPSLNLPKSGQRDPFFTTLMSVLMALYVLIMGLVAVTAPGEDDEKDRDDIWSIVHVPEKEKPKPIIKIEKPKVDLTQVKEKPPVPKTPPKPEKPKFKPAPAVEKKKVTQPKPTPNPVQVNTNTLANQPAKLPTPTPSPKPPAPSKVGTASTGATNPNFKLAGPKVNNVRKGKAGGAKGSGLQQLGGARKGSSNASYKGVEGVENKKASGVNLSKLGLGVGKILQKTGAGAKYTNFKNSAGGAGGGAGSASRTYGLGGVGNSKSVGLSGSAGAVNNFGSGAGGFLSGEGGSGGRGNAGISDAFGGGGRRRASIQVSQDPVTAGGGLTTQEIKAVIQANLNQIRHCYEQHLQGSPNAQGRVAAAFTVASSGRVSRASIVSASVGDTRMKNCITSRIQRWKFPKPRGGASVDVTYPFVFVPL